MCFLLQSQFQIRGKEIKPIHSRKWTPDSLMKPILHNIGSPDVAYGGFVSSSHSESYHIGVKDLIFNEIELMLSFLYDLIVNVMLMFFLSRFLFKLHASLCTTIILHLVPHITTNHEPIFKLRTSLRTAITNFFIFACSQFTSQGKVCHGY